MPRDARATKLNGNAILSMEDMLKREAASILDLMKTGSDRMMRAAQIYVTLFLSYLAYSFFVTNADVRITPTILIFYGILGIFFSVSLIITGIAGIRYLGMSKKDRVRYYRALMGIRAYFYSPHYNREPSSNEHNISPYLLFPPSLNNGKEESRPRIRPGDYTLTYAFSCVNFVPALIMVFYVYWVVSGLLDVMYQHDFFPWLQDLLGLDAQKITTCAANQGVTLVQYLIGHRSHFLYSLIMVLPLLGGFIVYYPKTCVLYSLSLKAASRIKVGQPYVHYQLTARANRYSRTLVGSATAIGFLPSIIFVLLRVFGGSHNLEEVHLVTWKLVIVLIPWFLLCSYNHVKRIKTRFRCEKYRQ